MARRLPSAPPNLPGFSYLRVLGSGGFADVFLYEQNMPRRQVAVKVLLAAVVNDQVRQLFQAEANVMAQLSSHPSILTVFQAGLSADGRPYLVMEYCSGALSRRFRDEPLSVPDALRIGIKIASAVETAHRFGILHRDIKPSNILVTAYGHPVLSDFGIAATLGEAESSDAVGLSIPWSAPEVLLDESSGSVSAEVWSLGATVYSLLAGRSPFEQLGADNSSAALMSRIAQGKVPAINRADVPARLEIVLDRAMSRRPGSRQRTVLEFIRELQSVEADLGLAQTPLEVAMDDWAAATLADPDDKTRVSGVNSIDPHAARRRRKPPAGPGSRGEPQLLHSRSAPGASQTRIHRRGGRGRVMWALVAASLLTVGLSATAAALLVQRNAADIPAVSEIAGRLRSGTVVFTWADPGLRPGDNYVVTLRTGEESRQKGTEFSVDATGRANVCLTVTVNREGKPGEPSGEKCVETAEGAP